MTDNQQSVIASDVPGSRMSADLIEKMVALCKDEKPAEWRDELHNAYLVHVPMLAAEIDHLRADLAASRADAARLKEAGRSLLQYLHHGTMGTPFCDSMASLPNPDCDCGLRAKMAVFLEPAPDEGAGSE